LHHLVGINDRKATLTTLSPLQSPLVGKRENSACKLINIINTQKNKQTMQNIGHDEKLQSFQRGQGDVNIFGIWGEAAGWRIASHDAHSFKQYYTQSRSNYMCISKGELIIT
jgi:hypothetical protein